MGGLFLINKQAVQTRDTTRKHHLQDLEDALYFAGNTNGNFPPYEEEQWCGNLEQDSTARQQLEEALRLQNEKYANPAKPWPTDPLGYPYQYCKTGTETFELKAELERDDHYVLVSALRDNKLKTR